MHGRGTPTAERAMLKIDPKAPHARACSWCPKPDGVAHAFMSPADAELAAGGAPITHGICPSCEARMLAALGS